MVDTMVDTHKHVDRTRDHKPAPFTLRAPTPSQQCAQRWVEEQEKTEAAQIGLVEVDAQTASRLAGLAQGLKDRQETVLAEMRREREVSGMQVYSGGFDLSE